MVLLERALIYGGFGLIVFLASFLGGYFLFANHYRQRFSQIIDKCVDQDSLIPLIDEIESES